MKNEIIIIGGGIAGMEAASQLLQLGYKPHIIEQADHLGGHLASWYRLFPDKTKASDLVDQLKKSTRNAIIHLNTSILSAQRVWGGFAVTLSNGESIQAKAVLVATGFSLFDAHKKEEYGYGIYNHVITNEDLEAWLKGHKDERIPKQLNAIGFVHCVGSRDVKAGNSQCSKVCCMTAIKQAIEMKERFPAAEVYDFYMDLRLFGKKYEDFYINAQQEYGVHFIRGRVAEVSEDINGRVLLKAEDTLMGRQLKVGVDLLVLMSGMVCNKNIQNIADQLKLDTDRDGFLCSKDNIARIEQSNQRGIFYAGASTGTKTVPETLAEARAAALAIHKYINQGLLGNGLRI